MTARSDSGVRVYRTRPTGPAQRERGEDGRSLGVLGPRAGRNEPPALPPLRLDVSTNVR
jgi:hypothetical protein